MDLIDDDTVIGKTNRFTEHACFFSLDREAACVRCAHKIDRKHELLHLVSKTRRSGHRAKGQDNC